jgi:hypothetical protein
MVIEKTKVTKTFGATSTTEDVLAGIDLRDILPVSKASEPAPTPC